MDALTTDLLTTRSIYLLVVASAGATLKTLRPVSTTLTSGPIALLCDQTVRLGTFHQQGRSQICLGEIAEEHPTAGSGNFSRAAALLELS